MSPTDSTGAATILIVDDDPTNLEVLGGILEHVGYRVRAALSGEVALRALDVELADLILLDVNMPGLDGYATCGLIKENERTRDIPVMFISALDDVESRVKGFRAGAVDYISKPFYAEEVLARAQTHVELYRITRDLEQLVETRTRELRQSEACLQQLNQDLELRVQEEVSANRKKDLLLIQQSRLATMGEMLHSVSHHWRQPLNTLNLILGNIKDAYEYGELTPEELNDLVAKGNRVAQQMSATIDKFRNFFQTPETTSRFDLAGVIENAVSLIGPSLSNEQISVAVDAPQGFFVSGCADELAQAILNILINAKEAIKKNGVSGQIGIVLAQEGDRAVVRIRDSGGGIPEDTLPRVFDPYFTTKKNGTGIGLYMSSMILQRINGSIAANNAEGGAEIVMSVPIA